MRFIGPFIRQIIVLALGLASVASAAQRLELVVSGDAVTVRWPAEVGHRYVVERAQRLGDADWVNAGEVLAAVAQATWVDPTPVAASPSRFYRVLDHGLATGLGSEQAIHAADLIPMELFSLYDQGSRDVHDAVVAATLLSNAANVVTNGTLTLTGDPNRPSATYTPTPLDRLTVVPVDGANVDLFIGAYALTPSQDDVIIHAWRQESPGTALDFRYVPGQAADLATMMGTYESSSFPGVVFEVDLEASLTGYSTVDSSGSEFLSDASVRGQLTAPGFALGVNTRRRYELITVSGGSPGSASTDEIWINHTLTAGGDTFVWNNVKKQRSYRDGKESNIDTYWNATGTVSRNGASFGQYRRSLAAIGVSVIDLRFQIELPSAVILEVGRWLIQVPGVRP